MKLPEDIAILLHLMIAVLYFLAFAAKAHSISTT
jgi:hypothetical protein